MAVRKLPCGGSVTSPDKFDGLYRTRFELDADDPRLALFVLAHPVSTSGLPEDPAEQRCREFGRRWGFGTASIVYLIPHRAPDTVALKKIGVKHGDYQHKHINQMESGNADWTVPRGLIVAAWGPAGAYEGLAGQFMRWFDGSAAFSPNHRRAVPIHCLGRRSDGYPVMPIEAALDAQPILYSTRNLPSDQESET